MTEDQKDISLLLEVLEASRKVPRTAEWLAAELRLAGRGGRDIHGLLRAMAQRDLVFVDEDSLGIERWLISEVGRRALDGL